MLRTAFTLIEVLVAIVIIMVLIGLLMPAISVVQRKAKERGTFQIISELTQAIEAYRSEDVRHRFPPVNGDQSISLRAIPGPGAGTLELLDRTGMWSPSAAEKDDSSRLLDPFGSTFRYQLQRPQPLNNSDRLHNWNWDSANNRERAWGRRPDASGSVSNGALAFPYVWSLGLKGLDNNATTWIYLEDKR